MEQGGEVPASVDDVRAERIAENEAAFRRANEMIKERAEQLESDGPVPFICECGDERCFVRLELTLPEYEEVRRDSTHFFVARGHEIVAPNLGRLARSYPTYSVVEKLGRASEVSEQRDPRRSGEATP